MSDNNLHRIFANTTCVSTEMMMNYLDGKLSEKEKNSVEVHIASCEMCRDEFEGLSLMQDKTKLAAIIAGIDEKVDERIKIGGKKISLFRSAYKIAATVIILIASAWFIKLYVDSSVENLDDAMVSQTIEEAFEAEAGIAKDSIIEQPTISRVTENEELERIDKVESGKGPIEKRDIGTEKLLVVEDAETEVEIMEEDISVDDLSASTTKEVTIAENKVRTEEQAKDEKVIVSKEKAKTELDEDLSDEVKSEEIAADYAYTDDKKVDYKVTRGKNRRNKLFKGRSKKQAQVLSNTVAIDNFDLAIAEYNKRDYKQAVKLFKKSLNAHINEDEVHFYLAKSYTNLDDTENALINYNKVIAMAESPYYEVALWNKSQILMELDKRKSAINSLNQLKILRGNYSKKAGAIIDSLNSSNAIKEK